MSDHRPRKQHKSRPTDSNSESDEPPCKVIKQERRSRSGSSEDGEQLQVRKEKHHHHHHRHHHRSHQHKRRDDVNSGTETSQHKGSRDLSPVGRRSDREQDRSRIRDKDRDGGKERHSDRCRDDIRTKIKQEPSQNDRDRVRPSSSKWDDDDDRDRARKIHSGTGPAIKKENDSHESRGRGGPRKNQKKPFFKRNEEDTSHMEWGKKSENGENKRIPPEEKDKPNFGLSGKLTEDANTFNGVVIKYSEPPEARKPKRRWRLYPFKGDEALPTLHIHRQSAFLLGRDRKVVDIPVDHPSCSKQHAALQYRLVKYERDDGTIGKRIRPYIIDLDSANGTYVNNNKIDPRKYVELMERDVVKFGYSSREYVLLHEHSKDDEEDDNIV